MCFLSNSNTFRASVALRSSLITEDNASGLMPCSQSRTQIDKVSISKPVFNILEISKRTVKGKNEINLDPTAIKSVFHQNLFFTVESVEVAVKESMCSMNLNSICGLLSSASQNLQLLTDLGIMHL